MLKLALAGLAGLALATVAVVATCTVASPWRRELRDKRLDEARPVDLEGLGSARLAPTFHAAGGVRGDPSAMLRGDARGVTFRFEQGQHHLLGGYLANPVLLDVTLLAAPAAGAAPPRIEHTTVDKFYPPADDPPRLAAHFAAQRWLPDVRTGGALTRVAATGEGRGDDVSSGPPERWLAIHLDPARRVRVDLWAWRSAYSADEARALVQQVAASVTTAPALDAFLGNIAAEDRRRDERRRVAPGEAATILRRCGVTGLAPGKASIGATCVAHLSADSLALRVVALVGRVPRPADDGAPARIPQFDLAPDAPTYAVVLAFWNGERWRTGGLQYSLGRDDEEHPVLDALATRLTDRGSVYLLRSFWVDFQHYPEGVDDLVPFLDETERQAELLRGGTLIPGVRGEAVRLGR